MATTTDTRKQAVYLPTWMVNEVKKQAKLYGVGISKIIQDCVVIARSSKSKKPAGIVAYQDGPLPVRKD